MIRAAVTLLAAAMALPAQSATVPDLGSPEGSLQAMVKLRCSLDPKDEKILWWKGTIFAEQPGQKSEPLLGFEGYNICRTEKQADGTWRLYTREIAFYRDLKTGAILDSWHNPLSGKVDTVVPVENDPVNQVLSPRWKLPWVVQDGQAMLAMNIPLAYPNPLQPDAYPLASSGPMYIGSEHFQFFTPLADLANPKLASAPAQYGWTRIGPWLPWMELGQRPGNLLYIAQGVKLASFDQLPDDIRQRIHRDHPEYVHAPKTWVQPNATSWEFYKKLHPAAHDGHDKATAAPHAVEQH
ncbi:MAG: DUF1838 family protein [Proteobacteria bacterium]|nr:DUF1838 family protein [Pseudomonadota bacterium]